MQSKQYFTKIKNYPHEKSTEPKLSLPLGTVKSRIFFTRQRLQGQLRDFV